MRAKTSKKLGKIIGRIFGILFVILFVLGVFAVSWLATCVIIKLITMCFGWEFSWGIATGVWLIMFLAQTVFKNNITVKK